MLVSLASKKVYLMIHQRTQSDNFHFTSDIIKEAKN